MKQIALVGGVAVLPDREILNSLVLIDGEHLSYVGPREAKAVPGGAEVVDAAGYYVLPGLIDTHVHGYFGDDVMHCGSDGIRRISAGLANHGVTAWLPSTISATHAELKQSVGWCLEAIRHPSSLPAADVVGIHVEGPYINLKRKGAQPAEGIRDPDLKECRDLLAAGEGFIKVVTLAPELPGGLDLIRLLTSQGVIASLGHSDATFAQATEAINAGATHATHLFNAMPPIHHREPGLIAACLNDRRVVAEVIPDGVHLHPETVRLSLRSKGADRVALITDGFSATGLEDGTHTLGPHQVTVSGSLCTLEDGTIAGSILTMEFAVRNAMRYAEVSLVEAVRMASLIPARVAGCADKRGSLDVGKYADVILVNSGMECHRTWVRGQQAFAPHR